MSITERTELLVGSEKMSEISNSCVAVFGIGGVGSFTAEALVRAGVGTLIIIDNDTVSESNINRQLIASHSTMGMKKIDAAKKRYLDINPELNIITHDCFVCPENCEKLFDSFEPFHPDYVCDCIDTVSAKIALAEYCTSRNIPVISCMGTGNKLHPEKFRISDISKTSVCPLCRVMRKELKSRGVTNLDVLWSDEQPAINGDKIASISYVPSVAGLLIAGHVINSI